MPAQTRKLGAFKRQTIHPKVRAGDAATYLFSTPANSARLREAIEDSRTNRNMVPFTIDDLRRELRRGPA